MSRNLYILQSPSSICQLCRVHQERFAGALFFLTTTMGVHGGEAFGVAKNHAIS